MREVLSEQVTVHRSPLAAWDHLARLEAWPTWAGYIRWMDPDRPGAVTASTEVVLLMHAGPMARMVVTGHDPPRSWAWEGDSPGVTTMFEHRFDEIDEDRTRISFLAWMDGLLAPVYAPVVGAVMHRNLARTLPRLKAEIEDTPKPR